MATATTVHVDAAATAWSAASFWLKEGSPMVFFDHQVDSGDRSGHSLLAVEPTCWLVEREGRFVEEPAGVEIRDPVEWMRDRHTPVGSSGELPFCGGLAGYLGFEFGWELDAPTASRPRSATPDCWVGYFPAVANFDECSGRWTVAGPDASAVYRLATMLEDMPATPDPGSRAGKRMPAKDVSSETYVEGVQAAVDEIYAGEFFEVNYTERFHGTWSADRKSLYGGLRRCAPGDYGGFVNTRDVFIASVSPEQFLEVDADGRVRTRPIKGTRPRREDPAEDERMARELVESAKDRAENVMIVDLMRNDLTKVCRPPTVQATEICQLHSFESVHHLVSTVEGELAEHFDGLDALVAGFPAGSITGAPKLRAMDWIANTEHTPRGPYTGSMFYWSNCGRLDSNVSIRTAVLCNGELSYGSGGAVVADSDPRAEYEEALWKAAPFFELLTPESKVQSMRTTRGVNDE